MALLEDLDIVNAACAMVGEEPLQSLEDESGQAAALVYQATVEFNLGLYTWSFGKQIYQLSEVADAVPLSGFTSVFDMPAERLGDPIYVTDDPTDPDRRFSRYALINSQVHADASPLYGQFRYRVPPNRWSPTFKMATIKAVAGQLAVPLTHDRALADQLRGEAYGSPIEQFRGGMLGAAIKADAYSAPPRNQNRDNNPLTRAFRS